MGTSLHEAWMTPWGTERPHRPLTTVEADGTPLLRMHGISKRFANVLALQRVDFELRAGEVHILLGENGAGKSTLVKILAGALTPDEGEIWLEGIQRRFSHPQEALEAGIAVVYQELNLVPGLTVAQNIFLGREPLHPFTGAIDDRKAYRQTQQLLESLEIDIPPRRLVSDLSVAQRQLVEIAKACAYRARVLVLDEPTSSLGEAETQRLFETIRRIKSQGTGIIYISHRLEELSQIGDRVTVLRDGRRVATLDLTEASLDRLIQLMVGRRLADQFPPRPGRPAGERIILSVEGLSRPPKVQNASLYVRAGEIVGLAGLMGSGRTELARLIFGRDRAASGRVLVDGQPIELRSPYDAVRAGIGFLTEDRKGQGLALGLTVRENATLVALDRFVRRGIIARRQEHQRVHQLVDSLGIRTPSIEQIVVHLSGGNQQKVVLAKWLLKEARLLIFDEPTRGIDVGARAEIYGLMRDLAARGVGILMISSDLREVLGMSDRIYVMRQGTIVGERDAADVTQEQILALAMGRVAS